MNRILFAYDIPRTQHAVAEAAIRTMAKIASYRKSYSYYLILKNRWKLVLLAKLIRRIRRCGGIADVNLDGGEDEPP